jgi:hypothetical protein
LGSRVLHPVFNRGSCPPSHAGEVPAGHATPNANGLDQAARGQLGADGH